jgi:hypothetical protein
MILLLHVSETLKVSETSRSFLHVSEIFKVSETSRLNYLNMKKLIQFSLVLLLLVSQSCASSKQNKWLSAHQTQLTQLANGKLNSEAKLDGLLADFVLFMKEDLKFVNPKKGIKYVQKYHDQNIDAIEKIIQENEKTQSSMNLLDKGAFAIRVLQKPYIQDLVDLAPKFKKKYNQYAFVAKMSGKMTGGLSKVAGKGLNL